MTKTQMDSRAFRTALGQFATGVTVITTVDANGNPVGMTANSFSSVSLDPMLVLWSIARSSKSYDVFMEASHFAIHVLSSEQKLLSAQFASQCDDRFQGINVRTGVGGIPLLADCSALFQCETDARHQGGDHIIIVGRVVDFESSTQKPLVFHAGRYADLELPVAV